MRMIFLMIIGLSSLIYADFSRSAEGVVTDSNTTLEWQDDYSDNANTIKRAVWQDAIEYCHSLTLDGDDIWRLPNIKELTSLVEDTTYDPAINAVFVHTESRSYLSSTHVFNDTERVMILDFNLGEIETLGINSFTYVRCVRGGQ